eukprot:UN09773
MKLLSVAEATKKINLRSEKWVFGQNRNEKTSWYLGNLLGQTPSTYYECRGKQFDLIHSEIYNYKQSVYLENNALQNDEALPLWTLDNMEKLKGRWIRRNCQELNCTKTRPCVEDEDFCGIECFYEPYGCYFNYAENNNSVILF